MIYSIFDKELDGSSESLGGKGFGLWWMQQQGINVPPALIIPTSMCVEYMKKPKTVMKQIASELNAKASFFKDIFGYQPLLSVRSGARVSMPGMMDTILNVGLETKNLVQWENRLGTDCVNDSYKRLVVMYGNVVKGIERKKLEKPSLPETLSAYEREAEEPFPGGTAQLLNSVEAVFKSWNNERAKVYRKMNNIPEEWGTAVVIQAMVFGNLNDNSGTGVLFTRDPDNGANHVVGEFLTNAQGEDVVAGIRTPMPLSKMVNWNPAVAEELINTVTSLEKLKRDVQDVEFTIMDGKLYILQTRNAKRSASAAVKIALDMMDEGLITADEAQKRVSEKELDLADQPVIDSKFTTAPEYTGIPACSGVVTGSVVLSSEEAVQMAASGKKVILVTEETTPDDIAGMAASIGILTMTGGSTSHAAVVARSMNRTCIVGLGQEHHHNFQTGMIISLDGATGRVWSGEVPVSGGENPNVARMRKMRVGARPLLVTSAPKFHVEQLVLDITPLVHLTDEEVSQVIKLCQSKCNQLHFRIGQVGASVFMTDADFNTRVVQILELAEGLVPSNWHVYGMAFKDHPSASVQEKITLDELVMTTSTVFLAETSSKLTPAQKKVLNWLSKDGVGVSTWNTKTGVGPVAYSVL